MIMFCTFSSFDADADAQMLCEKNPDRENSLPKYEVESRSCYYVIRLKRTPTYAFVIVFCSLDCLDTCFCIVSLCTVLHLFFSYEYCFS